MMKRILSRIYSVLTVVITLVSVVLLSLTIAPRIMGYKGYCVLTQSMEPSISKGSMVYAQKIAFEDVEVGDVLVFLDESRAEGFTHRVTRIDNKTQSFYTKGDANLSEDIYPTSYEYVAGKADKAVAGIGYITMFLNKTYGRIITVGVYIVWIAVAVEAFMARKRGVSR